MLDCGFFQAEDGIRDIGVTEVQTCALPISIVSAQERPGIAPLAGDPHRDRGSGGRARVPVGPKESPEGEIEQRMEPAALQQDRKSAVEGKGVDLGGRRIIEKKRHYRIGSYK